MDPELYKKLNDVEVSISRLDSLCNVLEIAEVDKKHLIDLIGRISDDIQSNMAEVWGIFRKNSNKTNNWVSRYFGQEDY